MDYENNQSQSDTPLSEPSGDIHEHPNYDNQGPQGSPESGTPCSPPPLTPKPPGGMATAAMILGLISLVGSCCFILSIPLGALSIILALLSKGYESKVSSNGKLAIGLSSGGLILTLLITGFAVATSTNEKGETVFDSWKDYYNYYYDEENPYSGDSDFQESIPYGGDSQDIENWLKDYLQKNGGQNDSMPRVQPYGGGQNNTGADPIA